MALWRSNRDKTIAFVLSGGANYGALQAGALAALSEHHVQPDILVGVSAGALNAAFLAANPTPAGVEQLQEIWRSSAPEFFGSLNRTEALLRLTRGRDSLLRNDALQGFIRRWTPPGVAFVDFVSPRLYVTAVRFYDGMLRVFGDDPEELLFDALMASTALPPLFPPWEVKGEVYVDGGIASDLPLQVAVERGANEIYALQITDPPESEDRDLPHGVIAIGSQVLSSILAHNAEAEIRAVQNRPGIHLHLIRLWTPAAPGFWDFTHADEMIAQGRRLTEQYLAAAPRAHSDRSDQPGALLPVDAILRGVWDVMRDHVQQTVGMALRRKPSPASKQP